MLFPMVRLMLTTMTMTMLVIPVLVLEQLVVVVAVGQQHVRRTYFGGREDYYYY
jgi:hypothetical protein